MTPSLYAKLRENIPREATPAPTPRIGQCFTAKAEDGSIQQVPHVTTEPLQATRYHKDRSKRLHSLDQQYCPTEGQLHEVQIMKCGRPRRAILNYNPILEMDPKHTLWLLGQDWVRNLEWDPKEWQWRRIGILVETSVLNYSPNEDIEWHSNKRITQCKWMQNLKRKDIIVRQEQSFSIVFGTLTSCGKFMLWLILTECLPIRVWRERVGLPNECQLCTHPEKETLPHAIQECPNINRVWPFFREIRQLVVLSPAYNT